MYKIQKTINVKTEVIYNGSILSLYKDDKNKGYIYIEQEHNTANDHSISIELSTIHDGEIIFNILKNSFFVIFSPITQTDNNQFSNSKYIKELKVIDRCHTLCMGEVHRLNKKFKI